MKLCRLLSIFILVAIAFGTIPILAQESSTHTVQAGENLFRIALRYGVDMNALAAANNIADPTRVYVGQELTIPGLAPVDTGAVVENPLVATAPVLHTVARGEYLGQIAQQYNVTVEQILSANNIATPNTIYPGQQLQIWTNSVSAPVSEPQTAPPPEPAAAPEEIVTHIVAPGEYLSQIAVNYGVNWTTIAEANNIVSPNMIYTGMALIIPGGDPSAVPTGIAQTVPSLAQNITPPGAHWGTGRELVVDLSTQMAYAYEDGVLQHSALVSTGLPATPTVQGEFAIWHRTASQTMTGPGYFLPNVPWVMYFYQGYGFHGTYWHNNFGHPMSHGCVNMTDADALWFYNFASLGTPVFVQL